MVVLWRLDGRWCWWRVLMVVTASKVAWVSVVGEMVGWKLKEVIWWWMSWLERQWRWWFDSAVMEFPESVQKKMREKMKGCSVLSFLLSLLLVPFKRGSWWGSGATGSGRDCSLWTKIIGNGRNGCVIWILAERGGVMEEKEREKIIYLIIFYFYFLFILLTK